MVGKYKRPFVVLFIFKKIKRRLWDVVFWHRNKSKHISLFLFIFSEEAIRTCPGGPPPNLQNISEVENQFFANAKNKVRAYRKNAVEG